MRITGGRTRFIMSMIVVVVLATICQSSQAAGKLRFYIDNNHNLHYDAGEEYRRRLGGLQTEEQQQSRLRAPGREWVPDYRKSDQR